ncbi:MAG: hypothetical protein IH795_03610 [Bacteroidetes bacterium]|nr:hypothetical protein [Bacteroidota bacterium]
MMIIGEGKKHQPMKYCVTQKYLQRINISLKVSQYLKDTHKNILTITVYGLGTVILQCGWERKKLLATHLKMLWN